jgi:hypothetical protein
MKRYSEFVSTLSEMNTELQKAANKKLKWYHKKSISSRKLYDFIQFHRDRPYFISDEMMPIILTSKKSQIQRIKNELNKLKKEIDYTATLEFDFKSQEYHHSLIHNLFEEFHLWFVGQTTGYKLIKTHPFKDNRSFRMFKHLLEHSGNSSKSTYTYIFNFIKEEKIDSGLVESEYFNFIKENYCADITGRCQPNATSKRRIEKLKEAKDKLNCS